MAAYIYENYLVCKEDLSINIGGETITLPKNKQGESYHLDQLSITVELDDGSKKEIFFGDDLKKQIVGSGKMVSCDEMKEDLSKSFCGSR